MIKDKLYQLDWFVPALVMVIGCVGVTMIFSSTGGEWTAGPQQHLIRLMLGFFLMIGIALMDVRTWMGMAYPAYLVALALLVGVEFFGVSVNGSQRWLDLGVTRIQPSEIMKLAVVLALARFYHDLPDRGVSGPFGIAGAVFIVALPVVLVMRQPDLGTSILIIAPGLILVFLSGVRWRIIGTGLAAAFNNGYQRHLCAVYFHQLGHGNGYGTGGWCAVAAGILWRHCHVSGYGRVRTYLVCPFAS